MTGQRRECACPRAKHAHGTRGGYQNDRCRCFPCRVAYSRIRAGQPNPAALTDRCGVRRRLEALHALGWTQAALGERLGVTHTAVNGMRTHHGPVTATAAATIAALYDALWDQEPPAPTHYHRGAVTRMRQVAHAHGWLPPLAWDDDEIDDPAAVPHNPTGESARELHPCGTPAAARRHWRRGEPLDEACKGAHRRERAENRARQEAAA